MAETAAGAWNKLQAERDEFSVRIKELEGEVAYEQERNKNNVLMADTQIKELTQQLADSAEAHTEKDKAIKSLTDSNLELARERDEGLHCAEQSVNSGILLNDQYERAIAQLTEANELLRKLEWCIEFKERYWCHICDRPYDKGHATDCRLAAHIEKGDTNGE